MSLSWYAIELRGVCSVHGEEGKKKVNVGLSKKIRKEKRKGVERKRIRKKFKRKGKKEEKFSLFIPIVYF